MVQAQWALQPPACVLNHKPSQVFGWSCPCRIASCSRIVSSQLLILLVCSAHFHVDWFVPFWLKRNCCIQSSLLSQTEIISYCLYCCCCQTLQHSYLVLAKINVAWWSEHCSTGDRLHLYMGSFPTAIYKQYEGLLCDILSLPWWNTFISYRLVCGKTVAAVL